uniref:Uncharacterized protein n=1 Tax=Raoultella planticola TaxID=575 RepID=W8CTK6_RAOPL|nr:hypothetical protein pKpNDM1_00063 [Raoultella planticola]
MFDSMMLTDTNGYFLAGKQEILQRIRIIWESNFSGS